jgi:hypothetical protein
MDYKVWLPLAATVLFGLYQSYLAREQLLAMRAAGSHAETAAGAARSETSAWTSVRFR